MMSNADVASSAHVLARELIATDSPRQRPSPPPARRRDKPQLSCNACRRRKVRCDRLYPCSNCSSRGLDSSCTYPTTRATLSGRPHASAHVQERVNKLENLVLSLMQQTASSPGGSPSDLLPATPDEGPPCQSPATDPAGPEVARPGPEIKVEVSPSPSDYGSIRIRESGVSYVSSAHWAAMLDSIAELRDHLEKEDEVHARSPDIVQLQASFPSPQLLYHCPMHVTPASILEAIPPRSAVDRLISRYFNDLDMATGVVHRAKFLREYEEFWKSPQATPIMWVGLLFTMMCLSTQFQQSLLTPTNALAGGGPYASPSQASENQATVEMFREKIIQCLNLGHYTKGGPYVVETLILYFLVELFPLKEVDIGIWLLAGNIVQIATHMGYHRDATHFPNISPFEGEMRRRVWAMIVQLDFSISTQMGLPRLIKESQTNTAEPRNLADSDFDEHTVELPPSRPETEVTPTLYTLSKLRILSVGTRVADVATNPRPYSYDKVLELDKQIDEARDALPTSMKWEGLASSLAVPPLVILQRIWLEICVQRLKIVLHKKFLVPSRLQKQQQQQQHLDSRPACLTAAMRILEFQHLIDEETQVDGLLYLIRWRVSTALTHEFLLATSVLCLYLQFHAEEQGEQHDNDVSTDAEVAPADRIRELLRTSQAIWLRLSADSTEARKAAAALRYVLGDSGVGSEALGSVDGMLGPASVAAAPYFFSGFLDLIPGYNYPNLGLEPTDEEPS